MRAVSQHLADTIRKRRQELGLDVQQMVDATGLTRQGLAPLLRGEIRKYQDRTVLPVCRVLGWTPDSIALVIAGGEPVELDEVTQPVELTPTLLEWLISEVTRVARDGLALEERLMKVERRITVASEQWSDELAEHQIARIEADQQLSARIDALARQVRQA